MLLQPKKIFPDAAKYHEGGMCSLPFPSHHRSAEVTELIPDGVMGEVVVAVAVEVQRGGGF